MPCTNINFRNIFFVAIGPLQCDALNGLSVQLLILLGYLLGMSIFCSCVYFICIRDAVKRRVLGTVFLGVMSIYVLFIVYAVIVSALMPSDHSDPYDPSEDTSECKFAAAPTVTMVFLYALALPLGCVYSLLFLHHACKNATTIN